MTILLKNGHVVDYVNGFEGKKDILIKDGFIRALGDNLECDDKNARVVDCNGLTVIPGICDMHVHLRDPGQTYKEDIITGCEAAVAGGVTALACMPNTKPPVDNKEIYSRQGKESKGEGLSCRLYHKGYAGQGTVRL